MATLNLDIKGNDENVKRVIADVRASLNDLQSIARGVTIDIGGQSAVSSITALNQALSQTQSLLTNIGNSSGQNIGILNANPQLQQQIQQTQQYQQQVAQLQAQLAQLRATQAQNNSATTAASGSYQEARNRLTEMGAALRSVQGGFNSTDPIIRGTISEYQRLRDEVRRFDQQLRSGGVTAAAGSYREAQQRLTALGTAIRNAQGGFNSTNPVIREQIAQYRALNDQLRAFDAQMGNHQRNVGNYGSALSGLTGILYSVTASYLSFTGAMTLANKAFQSALKTDATSTALGFVLKSATDAQNRLAQLREEADRLGLQYTSLAKDYMSFVGAARASNFSMSEAEKVFNAVSNASAKLHLTSDQTTGALLALQQMISKGTVQSEELRGQLGERLPGAFAIAARAMGVTEGELNNLLKSGEVTAEYLLPRLADELDRTFGNDKTQRVDSLQASVNRLSNTFDIAVEKGNINQFFKEIVDGSNDALSAITGILNSSSWKEFFARFSITSALGSQGTAGFQNAIGGLINTRNLTELEKFSKKSRDEMQSILRVQETIRDKAFKNYHKSNDDAKWFNQQQKLLLDMRSEYNRQYGAIDEANSKKRVEVADSELNSLTAIRKRITELSKQEGSADKGSPIYNRIEALRARLKELNSTKTTIKVEAEKGSFDALQKELSDLKKKSDSAIVSSDTFKRIQELEKRIKVLGDTMKNPVTLSDQLKKNFEDSVKALDKADFSNLKIPNFNTTISAAIDSIIKNDTGTGTVQNSTGTITDVVRQAHEWNKAISDGIAADKKRAKDSGNDYYQAFSRGVDRFATDFYDTLTTLNQQTDATFASIFATITTGFASSFQQIFLGQFSKSITNGLEDSTTKGLLGLDKKVSNSIVAGAGLAGGIISGVTSPTSSAGQGLGGALSGAGAGAAIGTALGGPLVGTVIGGVVGAIGGLFGASSARKRERELQEQQLEQLKEQTRLARQQALAFTSNIIGQQTTSGIVTGVDRDAYGDILFEVEGRKLKAVIDRESAAQTRGL